MSELLRIKDIIDHDDTKIIVTKSKSTNLEVCAAFNLDGKKLTIYEGAEDGSDDKELNIIEFLFNYEFKLGNEYDTWSTC